jgi:hypothetical protein
MIVTTNCWLNQVKVLLIKDFVVLILFLFKIEGLARFKINLGSKKVRWNKINSYTD